MSQLENQDTGGMGQDPVAHLWQWWTLENWRASADLLVKFATILGAIAVANFFVLKPEIAWEEHYYVLIDEKQVEQIYQDEIVLPRAVRQVVEQSNRNAIAIQQSPEFPSKLPSAKLLPGALPDSIDEVLREIYPEQEEMWGTILALSVPNYALDLAANWVLTAHELKFALNAIEASRYTLGKVTVHNSGQVLATEVKVIPPEGFTRSDQAPGSFDLPSGSTRTVTFRTRCDDVRVDPDSSFLSRATFLPENQFEVLSKPSEVLDRKTLLTIGTVFFVLWFLTVLKEIAIPPSKRKGIGSDGD